MRKMNKEIVSVAGYVKLAKLWEKNRDKAVEYHHKYYKDKYADDDSVELYDVYIDITGQKNIRKRPEMIRLLKDMGVKCNDLYPALTALKGTFFENEKLSLILSGLREYGKIYDEDDRLLSCGNIQFTDYGLSGIAVYDISHLYVTGEKRRLYFSLFNDKDKAYSLLCDCIKDNGMLLPHEAFCGLIHKKWIDFFLKALDIKSGVKVSDISKDKIRKMAGYLNRLPFDVKGYKGFEHAQVTGGGICLSEIMDDMSLRNFPGIYVTGEMLDVFGKCGGYNLHFAFATGLIAGEAVLS